jgi:hypothetical protein
MMPQSKPVTEKAVEKNEGVCMIMHPNEEVFENLIASCQNTRFFRQFVRTNFPFFQLSRLLAGQRMIRATREQNAGQEENPCSGSQVNCRGNKFYNGRTKPAGGDGCEAVGFRV